MDFLLSEEHKMIQETARDFAKNEVEPLAAELDEKAEFPAEAVKKLGELGFMGMLTPEEYGGTGMGNLALVLALIEINKACASTGVTLSVHNSLATNPIIRFGTEEQKRRYLPRMATGELLGAYGLSEPNAGSDAANIQTTVVKKGDRYILNGTKLYITSGDKADVIIIFARIRKEDKPHKGICAFIVEKTFKGFSVGKIEHKLGIRASGTAELVMENCEVPEENLLHEEGNGFVVAMDTLDGGRIGIASQAVGIGLASLEASIKYAKERKQFGKLIGEFQGIQWKLAEMAAELEASKLLTYQAAWLKDRGLPHSKEASIAKYFASIACCKAASDAVQIHGGAGFTKDFPVERYYRDSKITEIYEGTTEIQKIVISRHLLR